MAKRYVFWRMPNGKPYKKEDDKFAPSNLLAEHGKSASVVDGGIRWPITGPPSTELAVRSSVVVIDLDGRELNEEDSWAIAQKAIGKVILGTGGKTAIIPAELIKQADKEAAAHFRMKPKDYLLVSSLSLSEFPAKRIRISDCDITPIKERGNRFPFPGALTHSLKQSWLIKHSETTDYIPIKVKTSGRSHQEAAQRALDAVDLLRGLWTLFETFGSWTISMGARGREPVGVIHTAPLHTLHNPDGEVVDGIYWFEPNYLEDHKHFTPKKGWERIEKNRRWTTRRLKTLTYGKDVEQLIVRYVKALDNVNCNDALLESWSLLEKMTDTVGANYDETIERATWIFKDRKVARQELHALRLRRNMYVHSARAGGDSDLAAYSIKSFVEPHLVSLIRNDFNVTSLEEYGQYLALPKNADVLRRQKTQRQRALRMIGDS